MKTIETFTEPYMRMVTNTIEQMDWTDPAEYANWLAQTYYHICHSTRILAVAASRFYVDTDLHHLQCISHAKEEKSHEKIVLKDLANLGYSLADFPELPGTKALYRSAYYLIERDSPFALYGYVYFLELLSIRGGTPMMAQAIPAFGAKAVQHLKLHTTDDVDHIQAYAKFLNELKGPVRANIEEALTSTAENYHVMLQQIREKKYARLSFTKAA